MGGFPDIVSAPALLVSAHTDTVFPADTDLTVRRGCPKDGRMAGPGIGDNSAGLAGLLDLGRNPAAAGCQAKRPPVDIWLVANCGNEEGLGDLKGIRAAVDRLTADRCGAVLVIEGMGIGRIVHQGLGVRRYRIQASAPGAIAGEILARPAPSTPWLLWLRILPG